MTSIENKIIDAVTRAVKAAYPKADVESTYVAKPSAFPHVTIWEEDNTNPMQYQGTAQSKRYASLQYIVNIYCNDKTKKATAKHIADIIDGVMTDLGLLRTLRRPTPNADRTIFRMSMRYRGLVEEGITEGDTTTYIMHHS